MRHRSASTERDSRGATPRLRRWGAPAALFLALCARPCLARAQTPAAILVEREPSAEDCPDTTELLGQLETLLGRPIAQPPTPIEYRVSFQRGPQGYTAAIRSGSERTPVRTLHAREPNCAALAHATAITLTVLLDSQVEAAVPEEGAPASTQPSANAATAAKPQPPLAPKPEPANLSQASTTLAASPDRSSLTGFATLGAGALLGVVRPASLSFVADAGLQRARLRGSLGLLWTTPQTIALAPGSAREDVQSLTLRACYALAGAAAWRLDGCSGAFVGRARAEARGFAQNMQRSELFLAFPAGLAFTLSSGPVGWELNASALVLCPPNEFQIEGRGAVYQPALVAGLLTLRAALEPWR